MMKEIVVEDFFELLDIFLSDSNTTVYRGQADVNFELIPKAFRSEYNRINDEQAFKYFKRNGIAHLGNVNLENDWEYLAYAQHYSVPTRLLDWTFNPLVALFFAVCEMNKKDVALFKFDYSDFGTISLDDNPFQIQETGIYLPRAITNRILSQKGLFTIHINKKNDANKNLEELTTKYIISSKHCNEFAHNLHKFGISFESVYPDLEGISKYIGWRWVNRKEK